MAGLNLNTKPEGDEGKGVTETKPIIEQGNRKSLLKDPPAQVTGASASLLVDPEVGEPDDDATGLARLNAAVNTQNLANSGVIAAEGNEGTMYSSHPIANFRIGRFKFEKGLLRLDDKDAADFEKILESLPVTERSRVRKLDVAAAEKIVTDRLEESRRYGATQSIDSTIGERADPNAARVGTGRLGDDSEAFANTAQTDMNRPVHGANTRVPLSATDAAESQEADAEAGK